MLEIAHARRGRRRQRDVVGTQCPEDHKLPPRPRDRDIQPARATTEVQRTEVPVHTTIGIRPVADREQDHIPLIALNGFQVLDEDRPVLRRPEPGLDFGTGLPFLVEKVLDQPCLFGIEGNDPDGRRTSVRSQASHHIGNHRARLGDVRPRPTSVVRTGHVHVAHRTFARDWRREGNQRSVVIPLVRERDQSLVPAPVMPDQPLFREARRQALIQDALQILDFLGVGRLGVRPLKEVRRRQLLRITRHDHLASTGNRTDRIPDGQL